MLFPVLIDAEALKGQVSTRTIMRLNRSWQEKRRLHAQIGHSVLHNSKLDGDDAGHFDGSAERDFTVSLREMKISDAELGSFDMDG